MNKVKTVQLKGKDGSVRLSSRVIEELIQDLVRQGADTIEIEAYGQHGLGGRIFQAGEKEIKIDISGSPGQRVGAMGTYGTRIEVHSPVSDDVGWLNAGAEIIVHGYACNGACNAMAQGKVYVAGNIGSRGMTMTKYNPRFDQPELWVLGSAGDYFAEFMAGGRAVICGHNPLGPSSVLGYRPCVGMVGGKIFFRGTQGDYSEADAKLVPVSDEDWQWLLSNLELFLQKISKKELFEGLARRERWQCLEARTPMDKMGSIRRSMSDFRRNVWDKELGKGGLIGDLTDLDRSPVPLIVNGDMRR
ncbi:MAG: pyridine nucleotide-disulfide oxidoreductase, partial [Desulfovibrionales bacterium]|nr:pyridine nucleotide-disulfide oxidoreductase [Desulfovibrionales bacterium]